MFERVWSVLTQDIAIDLGTANTLVSVGQLGVVIDEPSVVAINTTNKQVVAVGAEAKKMLGRTPPHITAYRPLERGVISDFDAAEAMIRYFVQKVFTDYAGLVQINKPRVIIGVPSIITEVEARAAIDAARSAGARQVYVVPEPIAAAIGAGIDISSPKGHMIVDIGGGTTDIAIVSLSGLVVDKTIKIAGDEFDRTLQEYIKSKYNLQISVNQAEQLKKDVGAVVSLKKEVKADVSGRDLISNLPNTLTISSVEVKEALAVTAGKIVETIKEALEAAPPELLSDIIDHGIYLVGGGADLRGLDEYINKLTKLKVVKVKDPLKAVAQGVSSLISQPQLLDQIQLTEYDLV